MEALILKRFSLRRVFGKRTEPQLEAAFATAASHSPHRLFSKEIFESAHGDFLRKVGFAPDDPSNRTGQRGSTAAQLENDHTELLQIIASVNQQVATPIEPLFLLPPKLWKTRCGEFLIEQLDMSPYRPWNTLFLPVSRSGGLLSDLPLRNSIPDTSLLDDIVYYVDLIVDIWRGVDDEAAQATEMLLACVRENYPDLFPPEVLDMSPRVTHARANIRTLAVIDAMRSRGIDAQLIRKCRATILAEPAIQLVA